MRNKSTKRRLVQYKMGCNYYLCNVSGEIVGMRSGKSTPYIGIVSIYLPTRRPIINGKLRIGC